jgi:hypothetical protein
MLWNKVNQKLKRIDKTVVVSDHLPPFGVLFYPFEGQRRFTVNHLPFDGLSSVRNKCKSTPLMPSDQLIAVDGVPGAASFGEHRRVQLVPIFLGPNRDHKQTATGDISTKCG